MREVVLGDHRYPYFFGARCADRIAASIAALDADLFLVVTDETVCALHGDKLLPGLERAARVEVLSVPAGEGMKSLPRLCDYLERAIAAGASRRSVVVAFGGGVPGNLAGVIAALLYRGIRLVHVPTTTVAAMDSVISLKQAINSGHGKNHIGSYHLPEAVYTDLDLLRTLPRRELRSGWCEAAKNCLAIRPRSLPRLLDVLASDDVGSPQALLWLLEESLAAKLAVLERDAKEQRAGVVLEYGHTVGHAVELCDQRVRGARALSHGEAVAFGMVVAARVAAEVAALSDDAVALHEQVVESLGVPLRLPPGADVDNVLAVVACDNKRGYLDLGPDDVAMVLLRDIGEPLGPPDRPLVPVPISLVREQLCEVAERGRESVAELGRVAQ